MPSSSRSWRLEVFGEPKGQPRPRAFVRDGHARVYDPGTAEGWKSQVALSAREAGLTGLILECPVSVEIECRFPRPKLHFGTRGLKPGVPAWHTSTPDADNAAKAALDALTVVGVWRDDAQVYRLLVTKRYTASGEIPGATIVLSIGMEPATSQLPTLDAEPVGDLFA